MSGVVKGKRRKPNPLRKLNRDVGSIEVWVEDRHEGLLTVCIMGGREGCEARFDDLAAAIGRVLNAALEDAKR